MTTRNLHLYLDLQRCLDSAEGVDDRCAEHVREAMDYVWRNLSSEEIGILEKDRPLFYDNTFFRFVCYTADTVTPGIQQSTTDSHRILAMVAHMPVGMPFWRSEPLDSVAGNVEVVNDGEGRIRIRAADVERALWETFPDAVSALVGGDGRVHVYSQGALEEHQAALLAALGGGLKPQQS